MRKFATMMLTLFVVLVPLRFGNLSGTKVKMIRYSGKLIRIDPKAETPYFTLEENNTFKTKDIFCDRKSVQELLERFESKKDIHVQGKAVLKNQDGVFYFCDGPPNIVQKYEVQIGSETKGKTKFVMGQILEANPATGQIVYLEPNGRRGYLRIDREMAQDFQERIEKMERVEIKGDFYYDRVKGYYVRDGG